MQLIDRLIVLPCVKSCLVFTAPHDCSVEPNQTWVQSLLCFPPSLLGVEEGRGRGRGAARFPSASSSRSALRLPRGLSQAIRGPPANMDCPLGRRSSGTVSARVCPGLGSRMGSKAHYTAFLRRKLYEQHKGQVLEASWPAFLL